MSMAVANTFGVLAIVLAGFGVSCIGYAFGVGSGFRRPPVVEPPPACEPNNYTAHVHKVVDADTVDLRIDLPFGVSVTERVRVAYIDAPERHTDEGKAALNYALMWLDDGNVTLELEAKGRGKFGRLLGELRSLRNGESLGDALIRAGHAVPYMGGRRPKPKKRGRVPTDGTE